MQRASASLLRRVRTGLEGARSLLEVRDLRSQLWGCVQGPAWRQHVRAAEGSASPSWAANGAGKSTLLRAISGTLPLQGGSADAGSIEFEGRDIAAHLDPRTIVRAGIVQVPEGRRIFGELTVEENLRAGAISVRDGAARKRAYERVFDLFPRLDERRRQRAVLLSGGEQQMLAIGRALMSEPKLLLLDEPSLGLAPQVVERIAEVIGEINRQGTSVVLVEQNAAMALDVAETAYVLEVGEVTLNGSAERLARAPRSRSATSAGPATPRRDRGRARRDRQPRRRARAPSRSSQRA